MLSAAKHLLFLIENKQKQILRSAFEEHGANLLILRERGFGHVPCRLHLAPRESPTQDDIVGDFLAAC
jgi:hypothetical protein